MVIVFLVPVQSQAASVQSCISCHGSKGNPAYINPAGFRKSVHGKFLCTNCHMDITGYPHKHALIVKCRICHFTGEMGAPTQGPRQYAYSVHAMAFRGGNPAAPICQTCHGSHYILPVQDPRSRVSRRKIPLVCGQCHKAELEAYASSIHGTEVLKNGNTAAATCFDCHMEHRVPAVNAPYWKLWLIKHCGNCHPEKLNSYHETFHGQVTELGYTTVAKCSDCHGSHDILPPSNPESTLSPAHIVATCRQCHPHASPGFTNFYAHPEERNGHRYPMLFYPYVFMTGLLIAVFTFFFIHTALWAYRSMRERIREKRGGQ